MVSKKQQFNFINNFLYTFLDAICNFDHVTSLYECNNNKVVNYYYCFFYLVIFVLHVFFAILDQSLSVASFTYLFFSHC